MSLVFIVSPAKKMNVVEGPPYVGGKPVLLERTRELLEALQELSYDEAKALWHVSDRLAQFNYDRLAHMDLDRNLTAAVIAYEGIQYQHLAPQVMDEQCLAYLDEHLRILSGFYGVLRPTDGVVPYRLEMQARLAMPASTARAATKDLYAFWNTLLAEELAQDFNVVCNVASVEYAKAVTPYLPDLGIKVVTCLFGALRPSDGRLIQRSTEAKATRGTFIRWCAEHNVHDPAQLTTFDERGYHLDPTRSTNDTLVFVKR